jgi:hypothetical protein
LVCVECKPLAELRDPTLRAHLVRIGLHLREAGVPFIVVTEDSLGDRIAEQNCLRLGTALFDKITARALPQSRAAIETNRPARYGELQSLLGTRGALSALAHGLLYVDIHQPLDSKARLTLQPEENGDAADFLFSEQPCFALSPALPDCLVHEPQGACPSR